MKYALNLDDEGRILCATYEKYAPAGAVIVDELPDGDLHEYRYVDGEFVFDPIPVAEVVQEPTIDEIVNALLGVTE